MASLSFVCVTVTAAVVLLAVHPTVPNPLRFPENSPCESSERCVPLSQCGPAYNAVANGLRPRGCGFRGFEELVCCEAPPNSRRDTRNNPPSRPNSTRPSTPDNSGNEGPSSLTNSPSARACQEYRNQFDNSNGLGFKVLNALPVMEEELPFMAALGNTRSGSSELTWDCGGNLISDRYILTAAHCITDARARGWTLTAIRLGQKRLGSNTRLPSDYGVESIILHPRHRPALKYYDVALIRTDRVISFTNKLRPACLPPASAPALPQGTNVDVAGWGGVDRAGITKSDVLLMASVKIVSLEECRKAIKPSRDIPQGIADNMICAADPLRRIDTCLGDSGGPLLESCSSDETCTLIGITSFGSVPCGGAIPGVYTRVSSFVTWIESVVWK